MSATMAPVAGVGTGQPPRGLWAGPALVVAALALLGASVALFVRTPPGEMPLYAAQRYLVLDATSMLFLLIINSVFLGISVYMSSRVASSRVLERQLLPRAGLTLAFMLAMNLGVLANHPIAAVSCRVHGRVHGR